MIKILNEKDFLDMCVKYENLQAKVTTFHYFKINKSFRKRKDYDVKYFNLCKKDDFINIFKKATFFIYDEVNIKNYLFSTKNVEIFYGSTKIAFIDFSNELFNVFMLDEYEYQLILLEEKLDENFKNGKIHELQNCFNMYYYKSKKIDLSFYPYAVEFKKYLKKMYNAINFKSKIVKKIINSKNICFKLLKINGIDFKDFEDFDSEYFVISQCRNHLTVDKNVFLDLYIQYCEIQIDNIIKNNRMCERDGELLHTLFKKMVMLTKNEKV